MALPSSIGRSVDAERTREGVSIVPSVLSPMSSAKRGFRGSGVFLTRQAGETLNSKMTKQKDARGGWWYSRGRCLGLSSNQQFHIRRSGLQTVGDGMKKGAEPFQGVFFLLGFHPFRTRQQYLSKVHMLSADMGIG